MELPLSDPKLSSDLIRYGNFVAVFSNAVPLWAGVIMPPTRISQGVAQFSLYSGEALLKNRAISLVTSSQGSPGAAFKKVIDRVRRKYQPNLETGDVRESGRKISVTEPFRDALDIVDLIVENSGEEFFFEPRIVNNHLRFFAHWKPRVGNVLAAKIRLVEGTNMSADFQLEEAGDVIDEVVVLGKGDDPESRPQITVTQEDMVGLFGRWSHVIEAFNVEEMDELQNLGEKYLLESGPPTYRLQIDVLNVDNIWMQFGVGDTVMVELVSFDYSPSYVVPFKSQARVLARSFNASEGKMPIIVESYLDATFEEGIGS